MLTLDSVANFTWAYSKTFFLETEEGNFEWHDPDYGGDNTIVPFNGNYKDWCRKMAVPFGRDKGNHTIRGYCGDDVKIIDAK